MAVSWRTTVFTGLKIFVNNIITSKTPYVWLRISEIFYFYAMFQVLSFFVIYFLLAETKYIAPPEPEPDTSESEDLYWEDEPFKCPEIHPWVQKISDHVEKLFIEEGVRLGLDEDCDEMGREQFRKLLLDIMHRGGNLYDWDNDQFDSHFDLFIDHKVE